MRPLHAVVIALAACALLGCREPSDRPLEPVWNKQPCDHCAMILSEPRFAAELATADGEHHYFDDLGCMLAWLREHPAPGARMWVRDGAGWAPVERARYRAGAHTPMDYGLVAAADGLSWAEAQAAIGRKLDGDDHAR